MESNVNRQLADYAMASDLIITLSDVVTEAGAVGNILELFTMLCAPDKLIYLPLTDGEPGDMVSRPTSPGDMKAIEEKVSGFHEDYAWTESGNGFFLRVSHQEETVGILEIEGLAFPEYKDHYLNLALTISRVCGLAVANARKYQKIQQSERKIKKVARDLEQANEEVKQFAYIISHDLKAPLVNIKGFSSELGYAAKEVNSVMNAVMPHLNETQKASINMALKEDIPEALEFIESSAGSMDKLISSILNLSRLGRRELKPEKVNIRSIVESIVDDMAFQIEERNAKIIMGSLPVLVADQAAMKHIMGNLLTNAVKYFEPDRLLEIEITAEATENETVIHVRDNGRGIAESDMDKVFAPFRRAGEQNVPGDGMGLSYVQALVRRHGGRIWCKSEPGTGTVFSLTITAVTDF